MIIRSTIALLYCLIITIGTAQKIKMNVLMGTEKIGEINAEKKIKDKKVTYTMSSTVEAKLFVTVQVSTTTNTYWYNGMLTNSRAMRTSNMPGQAQTVVLALAGKQYNITRNSEKLKQAYPIKLCVTNLYFYEPVKDTTVFSEIQGVYLPIIKTDAHQYQIVQPNNKKETYTYINGKLLKIETIIAGKNVVFLVV
jgi:hypothetical protein